MLLDEFADVGPDEARLAGAGAVEIPIIEFFLRQRPVKFGRWQIEKGREAIHFLLRYGVAAVDDVGSQVPVGGEADGSKRGCEGSRAVQVVGNAGG